MVKSDSELVKSKIDIVDLISSRVDLKKAGKHFKGMCPFHADNDPSFIVSPELQIFKCFGCGKSGDVFTFLQEFEGMDFVEALELLAQTTGVTLTKTKTFTSSRKKFVEINDFANTFYQYILSSHPLGKIAREYIRGRGLSDLVVKEFGIGYSPLDSNPFRSYMLGKKKISANDLEKSGLTYLYSGRPKDRFAGRITFPLYDVRGSVLGFSGRILPENDNGKVGKYINSPETEIYHKSKHLFGLFQSKEHIRKIGEAIVVEGELDMISSFQAGIKNVVAIKGSALTFDQALILKRFSDKIIFALDADFAGNSAARKGIETAEQLEIEVRVARLEKFKDPDEAVRKDLASFKKTLDSSKNAWDFVVESILEKYDPQTTSGKLGIRKELLPIVAELKNTILKSHYIILLSRKMGVDEQSVIAEIEKLQKGVNNQKEHDDPVVNKPTRRELLEEVLISLAIHTNPDFIITAQKIVRIPKFQKIANEFSDYVKKTKAIDLNKFSSKLPSELVEIFQTLILKFDASDKDYVIELEETAKQLKILNVKDDIKSGNAKIAKYEQEKNHLELQKNQKKLVQLTKKLSDLTKD